MLRWMLQGVGILADGEGEVDHMLTRESPCLVMLQEIGRRKQISSSCEKGGKQTNLLVCVRKHVSWSR